MKSRSLWLLGVLLVSPAWSQEPAANTVVLSPRSFDRNNESIRKIVRDVAASQSVPIQLSAEAPVERKPGATFKYVPPVKAEPVKVPTPRLPAAPPATDGPISALFDVLLDTLLDVEPDTSPEGLYNDWLMCQDRDNLKNTTQRYTSCPGIHRDSAGFLSGPPVVVPLQP